MDKFLEVNNIQRLTLDVKNMFKLKTLKNMIACIVLKLFSTPRELHTYIRELYSFTENHLEPHQIKMIFNHPFTTIVAGPTRFGKTSWVVS